MREIVIKVPGNVRQVFDDIDEALKKLEELKNIEDQKRALKFILENAGTLPKDFNVSEEELHMQDD